MKGQNHAIVTIDREKSYDKIYRPFTFKRALRLQYIL